jgi:Domain of unknown function (DUF4162)
VKDGEDRFAEALRAAGCGVDLAPTARGGLGRPLLVKLPEGQDTNVVFDAAARAGVQVRQLQPQRASLEDAFLRTVGAPAS